jgi:hypothetical protein
VNQEPQTPTRPEWVERIEETSSALWREIRETQAPGWPPIWARAALAAGGVLIVLLGLVPLVARWLHALVDAATLQAWQSVDASGLLDILIVPVREYFDAHAAGLGLTPGQLWWIWAVGGPVLFVVAVARVLGARLGWAVYVAVTLAMVYAQTPEPRRAIATGLVAVLGAVLSGAAFRMRSRWHREDPSLRVLAQALSQKSQAVSTPPVLEQSAPAVATDADDEISWSARTHEILLRTIQARARLLHGIRESWTVTCSDEGHGFTARSNSGRVAAGAAISVDDVHDLLASLSDPPGLPVQLHWVGPVPVPPVGFAEVSRCLSYAGQLPEMEEFLQASSAQHDRINRVTRDIRRFWDLDALLERIAERADELNRTHPMLGRGMSGLVPYGSHDRRGYVRVLGWIDPGSVVGGAVKGWNDFADHRPEMVSLIIEKILRADDPVRALCEILSDDGIVHVEQAHGPAGPIHRVTENGNHRTHALRILGIPLIAAEITPAVLPFRLSEYDVHRGCLEPFSPVEPLWRALIERDLLVGDIRPGPVESVLEPHHVPVPWVLLHPDRAADVSAAYEHVYPGSLASLGIPPRAMTSGNAWRRWLLSS